MNEYDFSGWASKANLRCSDGRVIMKDAFKNQDGMTVPLVWGHSHDDPNRVLGHALLENREEGLYTYGKFNDTESGRTAKELVKHGDVVALSIYANQLKQNMSNVIHGNVREVSLVLAGANPGAFIDSVIAHGEECDEEAYIYTGEGIELYHADESDKEDEKMEDDKKNENEKTVQDVINSMTEEQQNVLYALVGQAMGDTGDDEDDENDKEENTMKHNVFDNEEVEQGMVLTHADEEMIMANAKKCGSFRNAFEAFMEENDSLQHGFSDYEQLFPENEWINTPGAPGKLDKDETWVGTVLNKIHKSPMARVRCRYADLREADLRALGYTKGQLKKLMGQFDMIGRSFDPQTVYVKEEMHRDDILDITDFDVVNYIKGIMRDKLNLELAMAASVGDRRAAGDPDKIKPAHIQPVYGDIELFTIYQDVDFEAAKTALQGTDTNANFGQSYIYAEAIIEAALFAREKYKGSGALDFYCTPHLLNVMLLARDLNGRRIYESKADLAAALDVQNIFTVEQFEGITRTTDGGAQKKLLGLFYNFNDYQFGSVKGGQITNFEDFDIDYNKYKYLMETRLSGCNTKVFSAIALEEAVASTEGA